MKVIKNFNIDLKNSSVVTIGNFDGIHRGHQELIKSVYNYSKSLNLTSIVISFNPHPVAFFNKSTPFFTIFSEEEKINEIKNFNIDLFIQCTFNETFANLEPEQFINEMFEKLNCKVLIIGEDYVFGKGRKGDYNLLKKIGDSKNIKIIKINHIKYENTKISSSLIKQLIQQNKLKKVKNLLNKPYYVTGKVLEGRKLGRTIGFPTINLEPQMGKIILPDGVYATKTEHNNITYDSITNIGKNPTVSGEKRSIETFIFNFNQEIYGHNVKVMFFDHIRNEKKFQNLEELKSQIRKDTKVALEILKNT